MKPLLVKKEPLSEADMEKFGKKDSEAYPFYNQTLAVLSLLREMYLLDRVILIFMLVCVAP